MMVIIEKVTIGQCALDQGWDRFALFDEQVQTESPYDWPLTVEKSSHDSFGGVGDALDCCLEPVSDCHNELRLEVMVPVLLVILDRRPPDERQVGVMIQDQFR